MLFRKRSAFVNPSKFLAFAAVLSVTASAAQSNAKENDQLALPGNSAPAVYEVPAHQFLIPTQVSVVPAIAPQAVPWPLLEQNYLQQQQQHIELPQNYVQSHVVIPQNHVQNHVEHVVDEIESPLLEELREKIHLLKLNPTVMTDNELNWRIQDSGYRLELAYLRLAKTAAWRRGNGADAILKWAPPALLSNKFPYEFTGFSREGYPVFYLPLAQWDFSTVFKAGHGPDVFNYIVRMLEDIRNSTLPDIYHAQSYANCAAILKQQSIIIMDVGSYGLQNFINLKTNINLVNIVKTIGRHYPYLAKKIFVVRAPLAVQGLWKVIRKVSTPPLQRAVEIYNRFSPRGQYALLHNIPRKAIPINLGGHFVPTTFEIHDPAIEYEDVGHDSDEANKIELNFDFSINRKLKVETSSTPSSNTTTTSTPKSRS